MDDIQGYLDHLQRPIDMAKTRAVNFAPMHTDGENTPIARLAQVVLIGLSRSQKSPTAHLLAYLYGIFVRCIPFVVGAPVSVFSGVDPDLVVVLDVSPSHLLQRRQRRRPKLALDESTEDYVNLKFIRREHTELLHLAKERGWHIEHVTGMSLEENVTKIAEHLGLPLVEF